MGCAAHFFLLLPSGTGCESGMAANLGELLERTVPRLGYELVDWDVSRGGLMRVFIDKDSGVTVEDCARVSDHLTRLFAVEDVDYDRLEISSPGLDRPLKRIGDYSRFAGEEAMVQLHELTDGTRKVKGVLRGVEGDNVLVETGAGVRKIPFAAIDRCRLVPRIEWRKGK
jgi:ribosome maturation factor RimP